MNQAVLDIIISAQDTASKVLKAVGNDVSTLNSKINGLASQGLKSMNSGFEATANVIKTGVAVGIGGLIAGLGIVGTAAIKGSGDFEIYRATLTTMLGSQELANARLKEYAEIGKKTPFELPQVVALGNQLQALGKYSKDNVTMLGDLASAAGKPIEQVSSAFSKLVTGQKGIAVDMFRDLLITTEDWTNATGKGLNKNGELMASTKEMMAVLPKIMADKKFIGMMDIQSQTLQGKWSNLMDGLSEKARDFGDKLLPIIKPGLDKVIDFVSNIDVAAIIDNFEGLFNILFKGDFTGLFGLEEDDPIIDVIFRIREGFQSLISFVTSNTPQAQAVLAGFAGVIGTLVVGALATMALGVIAATWPFIAIGSAAAGLFYLFQSNPAIQNFVDITWKSLVDGFNFFTTNIWPPIQAAFMVLWSIFSTYVIPAAQALWQTIMAELWPALVSLWNFISPVLIPILQVLAVVIGAVIIGAITIAIYTIVQLINTFKFLATIVSSVINGAISAFESLKNGVTSAINWVSDRISDVKNAFQSFWDKANSVKDGVVSAFQGIQNGITNTLKGIDLAETGRNIIQGLIDGITSMAGQVGNKAREIADSVKDTIKSALQIQSPSRVMIEMGKNISQGLGIGIDNGQEEVVQSTNRMAAIPQNSLSTSSDRLGQNTLSQQGSAVNNNNFYISGSDPKSIAQEVLAILSRQNRNTSLGMNNAFA